MHSPADVRAVRSKKLSSSFATVGSPLELSKERAATLLTFCAAQAREADRR